jgi:hypothetical protein
MQVESSRNETEQSKMYIVGGKKRYLTLVQARAAAQKILDKTGAIVSIENSTPVPLWRVQGMGSNGFPCEIRVRSSNYDGAMRTASMRMSVESCVLVTE